MSKLSLVHGLDQKPQYARAKTACAHFQIARSTLWQWIRTRKGFPQPLKAGPKVSLHDLNAIDAYLKSDVTCPHSPYQSIFQKPKVCNPT
jgi:predicted DNA-binding transcriptional regulator AlpA